MLPVGCLQLRRTATSTGTSLPPYLALPYIPSFHSPTAQNLPEVATAVFLVLRLRLRSCRCMCEGRKEPTPVGRNLKYDLTAASAHGQSCRFQFIGARGRVSASAARTFRLHLPLSPVLQLHWRFSHARQERPEHMSSLVIPWHRRRATHLSCYCCTSAFVSAILTPVCVHVWYTGTVSCCTCVPDCLLHCIVLVPYLTSSPPYRQDPSSACNHVPCQFSDPPTFDIVSLYATEYCTIVYSVQ